MFLDNKYTKWYLSIIDKAKFEVRKKNRVDYYESHHIIPKSMGGKETILLTAKEHYICHLLLCKMLTGSNKHKMINALIRMCFSKSNNQKRYTAKSYSMIRKFIAEKNSEMFRDVPKSEQARKNMREGGTGKWKRTEKDRERMRGTNNPMNGLTGDKNPAKMEHVRKKISERKKGNKCGLGNKSVTGLIWVNNGKERKMVKPDEIPMGYVKGKKYAMA